MFEEIKKVNESIYGFKIDGGKILLPQESHPLPEEVKRRADYFSEEFDSGMTFNGVMMCIFSENKPDFFDVVAGSDWLPKSEDFETWEDKSGRLSQFAVATYLIYGDHWLYDEYLDGWNRYEFDATAEQGLKRKEILWVNFEAPGQMRLL